MTSKWTCSILLLLTVINGVLADGSDTYTPVTYPNSLRDFRLCRVMDPSLACDPNHILNDIDGKEGIEMLHRDLSMLQETTNCSCTPEDNSLGSCNYPKSQGYTVSVAVLNKVRDDPSDPTDPQTRQQKVAIFGKDLRLRYYRGQCSDDAFIILSANDSTVWTAVGEVMSRKLTQDLITSVSMVAEEKYFVKKQYTEGLLYMVNQYTEILKGNQVTIVKPGSNLPIPLWLIIVIGAVILGIIVAVIVGIVLCCIRKSKTRGYEVGQERRFQSRL